jgi:hypothetical protein
LTKMAKKKPPSPMIHHPLVFRTEIHLKI